MKKILYIIMLSTFCFGSPADGSFTIHMIHNKNCGNFLEDIKDNENAIHEYKLFFAGFITGTNYIREREVENKDTTSFFYWIKNYCEKNPLNHIIQGLIDLDQELAKP